MTRFNFTLLFLIAIVPLFSQQNIGIGTTTPDSTAILEVTASDRGVLFPRLDSAQIAAISHPAEGLIVYGKEDGCLHIYVKGNWKRYCGALLGANNNMPPNGPGQWHQKQDFPGGARYGAVAFSIGGLVYVGLGLENSTYFQDFWRYDPQTDNWTSIASFPGTARYNAVAFVIDGKAYVGTGFAAGAFFKDFWEYDPGSDQWTSIPALPGSPRHLATTFVIGKEGYVGIGTNYLFLDDFWKYHPASGQWKAVANFPGTLRSEAAGFSLNNQGYVGTGYAFSDRLKDMYRYDPAADSWSQLNDFPGSKRSGAVAFTLGEKAYISTGFSPLSLDDCWQYQPSSDTWLQVADFGGGFRSSAIAASDGKTAYIGLGNFSGSKDDFWAFSPTRYLSLQGMDGTQAWLDPGSLIDDADWQVDGTNLYRTTGNIGIGTNSPSEKLELHGASENLLISNTAETEAGLIMEDGNGTGAQYATIKYHSGTNNLTIENDDSIRLISDKPVAFYRQNSGKKLAEIYESGNDSGTLTTFGSNGSRNVRLTIFNGYDNNGYIGVCDDAGNFRASMYVDSDGKGIVSASVKYFSMPHPTQSDKEIWYSSVEGPEAGAYLRGTAQLKKGKSFVPFPEHFQLVINPTTMTVQVTPQSGKSKGLAVVKKTQQGFWVEELRRGRGSYKFDWTVIGVRKGYEDFQVIRNKK